MIEFVYGHDKEIVEFISTFAHGQVAANNFGNCKTIGIIDNEGKLIAGIIYFNYDPRFEVIEIGVASITPRWFTRPVYRRMFEYPFIECGCQMIMGRVRADHEYLLNQYARLNFNLTIVPRMYGRNDDGVLCTLTDDQWLDNKFSKRIYRNVPRRQEEEAA